MRRSWWVGLLGVGLLAVVVSPVVGQGPGGGGFGGGGRGGFFGGMFGGGGGGGQMGDPMALVQMDAIKQELEIMDDQSASIGELREEMQKELEEATKVIRVKYRGKLEEVLLPHQTERVKQISVQLRGIQALSDEEVIKELGITTEQTAQMTEIRTSTEAKIREMFNPQAGGGGNREQMQEMFGKMQTMRQEMETQVLGVLSEEQKTKFESMKGEEFDRSKLFPQGGPGGGRGGRGQGGGGFGGGQGGAFGFGGGQGGAQG